MTTDAAAAAESSASSAAPDPAPAGNATASAGATEPAGGGLSADSSDAFDESGLDAYAAGRRVLSPGPAVTVMSARDAHISIQPHFIVGGGRGVAHGPGSVRTELLATVSGRYVKIPEYDDIEAGLKARHLVVLVGPAGTGRTTTALHLLDDVSEGKVSRLDGVQVQPEQIERGNGYLGELTRRREDPTPVEADRLADAFERQGAFCVLVATSDPAIRSAYGAYLATCSAPDVTAMLRTHIEASVGPDDDEGMVEHLMELADSERFGSALGPAPRPHEVATAAGLLVARGRGELSDDGQLMAQVAGLLDDQIAEWFSILRGTSFGERAERARRLTALRIAAAVFDGMPYHVTTVAAEALAGWMAQPPPLAGGQGVAPAPVPAARPAPPMGDAEDELQVSRLQVERGTVRDQGGKEVAAAILRFRDPRTPVALLRFVWDHHMWLRRPIVAWLEGLGRDPRKSVRVRASQATGLLCSFDFSHTFYALVQPAATARVRHRDNAVHSTLDDESDEVRHRRREFAAGALDHAARNPEMAEVATRVLQRWRRGRDVAQQWTAAAAWGLDMGRSDLDKALEELRIIGTPQERFDLAEDDAEWDLIWIAGLSLAKLFATGAHHAVIELLENWLGRRRQSLTLLSVQAVVLMADLRVSAVEPAESAANPEDVLLVGEQSGPRSRWPVLLALHDSEPDLAERTAALLRAALRSPWGGTVMDVLSRWFVLARNNAAALAAIEEMLPLLVRDSSDATQLRRLVQRRQASWTDPLDAAVATRLIRTIEVLGMGKKVQP
jgi:hypothetical protein